MARTSIQNANASLYFNGTSTKVITPANLVATSTKFTVATWAKIDATASYLSIVDCGGAGGFRLEAGINGNNNMLFSVWNGASQGSVATATYNRGVWYPIVATFNSGTLKLYRDNTLISTTTGQTMTSTTSAIGIGSRAGGTQFFRGNLLNTVYYDGYAFTATDVTNYSNGILPTGATAVYPLNEGAGTIAYDTSGNGNNGTITSPTWTRETPSKTRKGVNGNLVYNGNFGYTPQVNTAQTVSGAWIDGAAGGSSTNFLFGWACNSKTGTVAVKFDITEGHDALGSIKLSTTATGSQARVSNTLGSIMSTAISPIFSVLPSTSYTYSFWMKTNYISGDATTGAQINFIERTATASSPAGTSTAGVKTTTDWTQYTGTITTTATTRFLTPDLRITGNDGTGTLIMDAWFDDITLTPTTATTRTAATGRSTASSRSAA